jgi:hypothetical protein
MWYARAIDPQCAPVRSPRVVLCTGEYFSLRRERQEISVEDIVPTRRNSVAVAPLPMPTVRKPGLDGASSSAAAPRDDDHDTAPLLPPVVVTSGVVLHKSPLQSFATP